MTKSLPLWGKIFYGLPPGGYQMINQVVVTVVFFFYNTGATGGGPLVPPIAIGSIFFLGRIVDAVTDPLIAKFSDNLKSKWGRRIPFMFVSGILLTLSLVALFYPPVRGEESVVNAVYLAFMLSAYFTIYTGYVTPYLALLPELAKTKTERVDLSTNMAIFMMVGNGAGLISAWPLEGALGFQSMSLIIGTAALVFLYPVMAVREKEYADSKPADLGVIEAVKKTLQNKPFLIYLIGCVAFWFGGNIVMASIPFYVTVLLGKATSDTVWVFVSAGAVSVISFPIINILAKRWGLKNMMLLCMASLSVMLPFFYFLGRSFMGIDPFIIAIAGVSFAGFPIACLFIVPNAIVAMLTDYDEKMTGQRREAMYFGTQGLIMKIALGFSSLVMGALFQMFGQSVESPLGVQLTGPVSALFVFIGFLLFLRYPEKDVAAASGVEVITTDMKN